MIGATCESFLPPPTMGMSQKATLPPFMGRREAFDDNTEQNKRDHERRQNTMPGEAPSSNFETDTSTLPPPVFQEVYLNTATLPPPQTIQDDTKMKEAEIENSHLYLSTQSIEWSDEHNKDIMEKEEEARKQTIGELNVSKLLNESDYSSSSSDSVELEDAKSNKASTGIS
ncbi:hypothetical protein JTB14_011711 [Gonioctena quinquepunctata]|nr:hypothetical protein JTB14_011711 [Gonioctena quinquepunctata]